MANSAMMKRVYSDQGSMRANPAASVGPESYPSPGVDAPPMNRVMARDQGALEAGPPPGFIPAADRASKGDTPMGKARVSGV